MIWLDFIETTFSVTSHISSWFFVKGKETVIQLQSYTHSKTEG